MYVCNYTTYNYFSGLMCVDKRKSCPSWASQGDCKTNGWTEMNCRISCKTRCDTLPVKPTGKYISSFSLARRFVTL